MIFRVYVYLPEGIWKNHVFWVIPGNQMIDLTIDFDPYNRMEWRVNYPKYMSFGSRTYIYKYTRNGQGLKCQTRLGTKFPVCPFRVRAFENQFQVLLRLQTLWSCLTINVKTSKSHGSSSFFPVKLQFDGYLPISRHTHTPFGSFWVVDSFLLMFSIAQARASRTSAQESLYRTQHEQLQKPLIYCPLYPLAN